MRVSVGFRSDDGMAPLRVMVPSLLRVTCILPPPALTQYSLPMNQATLMSVWNPCCVTSSCFSRSLLMFWVFNEYVFDYYQIQKNEIDAKLIRVSLTRSSATGNVGSAALAVINLLNNCLEAFGHRWETFWKALGNLSHQQKSAHSK